MCVLFVLIVATQFAIRVNRVNACASTGDNRSGYNGIRIMLNSKLPISSVPCAETTGIKSTDQDPLAEGNAKRMAQGVDVKTYCAFRPGGLAPWVNYDPKTGAASGRVSDLGRKICRKWERWFPFHIGFLMHVTQHSLKHAIIFVPGAAAAHHFTQSNTASTVIVPSFSLGALSI